MPSADYIQHRKHGPFPGRIDPWAEVGRYFHQLHAGMIDNLLTQIQDPLLALGYEAGRESSLQIMEGREPDIFVQRAMNAPTPSAPLDYELAATELLAEPGVIIEDEIDLQSIHIKHIDSGRLIAVIEIVSPNNKTKDAVITDYRLRRERLLLDKGINIVEIDPTRSVKHLMKINIVQQYAYHIAVYLPGDSPRFIGLQFEQPLSRVALPLRTEAIPMELQAAYDYAYRQVVIAGQITSDGRYDEDFLPFPSLLTDAQRQSSLDTLNTWKMELKRLAKKD
jgi:hypothetical protein